MKEMPTDGTCRRHLGDENLLAYGQLGTFAEYAVLSERSVIKIDEAFADLREGRNIRGIIDFAGL